MATNIEIQKKLAEDKSNFIEALVNNDGNIKFALESLCLPLGTYQSWRKRDSSFARIVDLLCQKLKGKQSEKQSFEIDESTRERISEYENGLIRILEDSDIDVNAYRYRINQTAIQMVYVENLSVRVLDCDCSMSIAQQYIQAKKIMQADFDGLGITINAKKLAMGKDSFNELMKDFNGLG